MDKFFTFMNWKLNVGKMAIFLNQFNDSTHTLSKSQLQCFWRNKQVVPNIHMEMKGIQNKPNNLKIITKFGGLKLLHLMLLHTYGDQDTVVLL